MIVVVVMSLIHPQNYDWDSLKRLPKYEDENEKAGDKEELAA